MGLTNSFGGCIITVNMPAPAEALRSGARLNQSGSIAALNLFESRAKRDTLIDRVVSFGTVVPKSTTSKIPVLSGEVLKTPVALDYTTGVINVTPPTPEDPRKDLSHDSVKKRSLNPWRRALIAVTAVASGLTAVGIASPTPAEAGGNMKLVTASSEGTNCVKEGIVLTVDPDYARQIASGEVVIATRDNLLAAAAAAAAGDTAVIQPISPEEAWQNLVIVVPACPPVVEPTPPAPKSISKIIADIKEESNVDFPDIKRSVVTRAINNLLRVEAEAGATIIREPDRTLAMATKGSWDLCVTGKIPGFGGDKEVNKKLGCVGTGKDLYIFLTLTGNKQAEEVLKLVIRYGMNNLAPDLRSNFLHELQ